MGLNPQESFAKMDEERNVENGVRGQMSHLNPPMVKEASEEIRNRKTETPKNMRKENNRFVSTLMRKRFPHGPTPMDHASGSKKMFSHKIQKMGVDTLTRLPPMELGLANGSIVHLPL